MQSLSVLAVLAIAFSCTLALDVTLNQHWKLWKEAHNKRYSEAVEQLRFVFHFIISISIDLSIVISRRNIWESNLKIVNDHNLQADFGVHTYWLGMNKYADLVCSFKWIFSQFERKIFLTDRPILNSSEC